MKTEIEHIQHLLQKSKVQVQREFEEWWKKRTRPRQASGASATSPRPAWPTPPPLSGSSTQQSQETTPTSGGGGLKRHQVAIAAQVSRHLHGGQLTNKPPGPPNSDPAGDSAPPPRGSRGRGVESVDMPPEQASPQRPLREEWERAGEEGGGSAVRGGGGGGVVGTDGRGGLYQDSWQPADSLSPPSHAGCGEGRVASSDRSSLERSGERHLPKKKHLFPTILDFDSHIRYATLSHLSFTHTLSFHSPPPPLSLSLLLFTLLPLSLTSRGSMSEGDMATSKKAEDISPRSSIPLTGDPKADADIIAFYKARQKLIKGLR